MDIAGLSLRSYAAYARPQQEESFNPWLASGPIAILQVILRHESLPPIWTASLATDASLSPNSTNQLSAHVPTCTTMSILFTRRTPLFAFLTLSLLVVVIAMASAPTASPVNLAGYQAPLRNESLPEAIPEWYIIELRPGHTMEQHSEAVGTDMNKYLHVSLDRVWVDRVVYVGANVDDELLGRVRKDPGVREVRCDTKIKMEEE
ncbi:hypothetical protein BU26DRAFT_570901 [Trematosphaeria pertusa]|uniref:Inhibitor I9 domain-containing protein n=1 Tax=Trematosphaeria pertusa TaxID=390896 RepID=A0A6A6HVJ6_9PLEO|nr:uncharacterized protein BU26DRAFT_570901 [Trematosphaeria pertusa]KAF2242214.1 hypothetical protein BU26DRAFT_570901 [Trematosphaeria pertusa]